MKFKHLLLTIILTGTLPLLGSAPSASNSASIAYEDPENVKMTEEKHIQENPSIVKTSDYPDSVVFHPSGKFALVNNRLSGTISVYLIDQKTGVFKRIGSHIKPIKTEKTPNKLVFTPDGNFLAVVHGWSHRISIYKVNTKTGVFTPVPGSPFKIELPAELITNIGYFPHSNLVAVSNSENNNVYVYAVDKTTGAFFAAPIVWEGKGSSLLSPDGRFAVHLNHFGEDEYEDTITVYSVNKDTGKFTPIPSSPFPTGKESRDVKFSPDGNFIAIINQGDNSITVYKVNSKTGALNPVPGSPFATGSNPWKITYCPDGRFAVVNHRGGDNALWIYKVDHTTGIFTFISKLIFKTKALSTEPLDIIYSPKGNLAVIIHPEANTMNIYEVNSITGALTPLTGEILQNERARRELEETSKAQKELGILHPQPIPHILSEYIVGPEEKPNDKDRKESKEDSEEKNLQEARDKTEQQEKAREQDKVKLFEAIGTGKDIDQYLTPFTINAPDVHDDYRTPLMKAIGTNKNTVLNRNAIITKLLNYRGKKYEYGRNPETVPVNLFARDQAGNNALMLAIIKKDFELALHVAKLMIPENETLISSKERMHQNSRKLTAYDLAARDKVMFEKNPAYQKLMELIKYSKKRKRDEKEPSKSMRIKH